MTSKEKKRFSRLISEKKDEIRKRYALRRTWLADRAEKIVGDIADKALEKHSLDVDELLEEHDLVELQNLEEAQRRLEYDDFGYCKICDEPIEISRLLIVPETTMCCACSRDMERRKRWPAVSHGAVSDAK